MKQSKKKRSENILESCFFCNNDYLQSDILPLEEKNQKVVFHATCSKCNVSVLIFSSVTNMGIVNLGMATDLDKKEVRKMFCNDTIDVDDILEMHEFVYGKNAKRQLF